VCRLPLWAVVGKVVIPSRKLRAQDHLGQAVYGFVQHVDSERVVIEVWRQSRKSGMKHKATYILWFKHIFDRDHPLTWHPDDWRPQSETLPGGGHSQLSLPGVDTGL
jgi:hypothetical protein